MPDSNLLLPGTCLIPSAAPPTPRAGAVYVPLEELADRTQELPPPTEPVPVAADDDRFAETAVVLETLGRTAQRVALPNDSAGGRRYRLWKPTAVLETWLADVPVGTSLDLACGSGRDVVYLASRGWHAHGVDWLPDACERGHALAACYLADPTGTRFSCLDLEEDVPAVPGRYDLITGFRYLHRPLFPQLVDWLRPGGYVLWETFTETHRARHGKPRRDAFVLRAGELAELLTDFEIVRHEECWHGSVHTARVLARSPRAPSGATGL